MERCSQSEPREFVHQVTSWSDSFPMKLLRRRTVVSSRDLECYFEI